MSDIDYEWNLHHENAIKQELIEKAARADELEKKVKKLEKDYAKNDVYWKGKVEDLKYDHNEKVEELQREIDDLDEEYHAPARDIEAKYHATWYNLPEDIRNLITELAKK